MFGQAVVSLFLGFAVVLSGCAWSRPVLRKDHELGGHFEFKKAQAGWEGIVIAVPHGLADKKVAKLAEAVSEATGAGLVIAYGFASRRLSVAQPIFRWRPPLQPAADRKSVFREFRSVLEKAAGGEMHLYVGFHASSRPDSTIEVATGGVSFEEARVLKERFAAIQAAFTGVGGLPARVSIEPLDRVGWRTMGLKHHGVLLAARKGLSVRVPRAVVSDTAEQAYRSIFALWVRSAVELLAEGRGEMQRIRTLVLPLGRLESVKGARKFSGVVIGAPHGSFDPYTAEMAMSLADLTGIAAVIAKGFTPTETGGWRINVNRPTEEMLASDTLELHTERARDVYARFRQLVFEAAGHELELYIDIHQYGAGQVIQVATTGLSTAEARVVKLAYGAPRRSALEEAAAGIAAVDLLIEPLDLVEMGAWAAKAEGILRLPRKSLHVELPNEPLMRSAAARQVYASILGRLFVNTIPFLLGRDS